MKTIIKICGNRCFEDVLACIELDIPYIGFIFADSKRNVQPIDVQSWIQKIQSKHKSKFVGVFVNPSIKQLDDVLSKVDLDVIQLHGNEAPSFLNEVRKNFPLEIWKALHHYQGILDEMKKYMPFIDGFVIDSKVNGQWGGTGISFDWRDVPIYTKLAKEHNKYCLIAGGIHPENVELLLQKNVTGIDLASGVEKNNRKCRTLMQMLVERVNGYESIS